MKKGLALLTVMVLTMTALSLIMFSFCGHSGFWKTMSITFSVTTYHFMMRLLTGYLVARRQYQVTSCWFREKAFEKPLYKVLRVKKWKQYLPTYSPELFDIRKHDIDEIIGSTCQAELGHEAIMALSYLPLFLIPAFGAPWVFVITSVASSLADSLFVIVQRYNRPRLIGLKRVAGMQ